MRTKIIVIDMKKRLIAFIAFLAVMMYVVTGCDKNEDRDKEPEKNENITMRVSPEVIMISPIITLIIENHTNEEATYTRAFSLEYFDGNSWILVQSGFAFGEDIVYTLQANETAVEDISLYAMVYYYENAGKYRINKEITLGSKVCNLSAEFEIKIEEDAENIIGKWKLVRIMNPALLGPRWFNYFQQNIVYEFKENGVFMVSGKVEHIDMGYGYEPGEYFYTITENDLGKVVGLPCGVIENCFIDYMCRCSSNELEINNSWVDGATFYFVKVK